MRRFAFALILLLALGMTPPVMSGSMEKPLIIATIAPLGEIIKEAFGSDVEVEVMVPLGVDPHEYQLSPEQIEKARNALVIVTTGGHLPAEKKLKELGESGEIKGLVLWIDDYEAEGFKFLEKSWMGGTNPHGTWMDPENALAIARATEKALIKGDPGNRDVYERDYNTFESRINEIVDSYRVIFQKIGAKRAVIELPAHQYALEWLGVETIDAIKPEEEVPAKSVDELLNSAKNADLIVYTIESPNSLKNAALELSSRSGKPLANVVYMWTNKPYTQVLKENTGEILKALSGEQESGTAQIKKGVSESYILLALITGIVMGFAFGMFVRRD